MRTESERRAGKRYYERNRDRIKAKNAAYRIAHPVQQAAWNKRWRERHPDRAAAAGKTPHSRLVSYRLASKRRGIVWNLPATLALDLLTDFCFYCGSAPLPTNGIDRVDNGRGYEYGNVVTACAECNRAKGTRTREQFEQHAIRVAKVAHAA